MADRTDAPASDRISESAPDAAREPTPGPTPSPSTPNRSSPAVAAARRVAERAARAAAVVARRWLAAAWVALLPRWPRLTASIGGGLALVMAFPPFGWWYLVFVAFALLGWTLTRSATTRAGGFGYGFLFGMAFFTVLLPWISGLVGWLPWLLLSALEAAFCGLFGLLAVLVRRLPGWPVWLACTWLATEWARSVVPFGGFPWGAVGFSQDDGPLLYLAHFGGVPLVSFAAVLVGFALCALAVEGSHWWQAEHHRHGPRHVRPHGVVVPGAAIALVLLLVAAGTPFVRRSGAGAGEDPSTVVGVVQGNVPRLGLDFNAQRRAVLDNHVDETMRLADDVRAGRAPRPAVVIWPENSSDVDPLADPSAGAEITSAAEAVRAPLLVGTVLAAPGYTPQNPVSTNTVLVWDADRGPGDRHDKQIIQPFGEYLPWRSFFRMLSPYADRAGYFVPVAGDGVVHAAGLTIGVTTCWEVIFDRAARESVRSGAQFLAVPTNNATFDEPMSAQQLGIARLRAVEHDRYVVVAGTTGISAIVAPDGTVRARTGFFEPAHLDMAIRLKSSTAPATTWTPYLQALLICAGVGAVLWAMLHNESLVRRLRRATTGAPGVKADGGDDEGAT